jgi:hypothetical protein
MTKKYKYLKRKTKSQRKIEEKRNLTIRKVEDKTDYLVADHYNAKTV